MKKLSLVLIILGILIILIPLLGNIYISNKQSSLYKQYLNEMSNNTHNKSTYITPTNQIDSQDNNYSNNTNSIEKSENTENIKNTNNTLSTKENNTTKKNSNETHMDWLKVIGKLKIKKINVDLLFLKGSSDLQLLYGAGHMDNTAFPGDIGNCCIAAHRGYYFGTYLYRANELNKGDIITVVHLEKKYNYSVSEKFYVSPKDTYILKQPNDKKILTIITCDPPIIGTRRLIIQANLIENNKTSDIH